MSSSDDDDNTNGGADPSGVERERARFRAVFDHAPDPIVILDEAAAMVDVNAAACALFGRPPGELVGLTVAEFTADPQATRSVDSLSLLLTSGALRGELTIACRDGSTRLVEYNATANVTPGRHLVVFRNIDARRRAEIALEFLAESSAALASSLDYDATLASVVKLAVPMIADWAMVDMKEDARVMRRIALAHRDPALVAKGEAHAAAYPVLLDGPGILPRVLRTGVAELIFDVTDTNLEASLSDKTSLDEMRAFGLRSYMAVPFRVREQTIGVLGFAMAESGRRFSAQDLALVRDLARRAGVAIENAVSYREAQEANRLKDEFLATVSHELRTPLNAILGWATLLRTRVSDPAALQRGLETIERNAKAQARLIDDVLDVSRIITGKLHIEPRRVDMVAVVRAALEVVATMATARNVTVEAALDDGPCILVGDADRLQQIAWNLLSNAIKFTRPGGVVTVGVARDGATVQLRVTDTGQGIAPDFLPFIFDRFRQADSSSTRAHGGLGLGLAIVRHLAELHGGRVVAESDGVGLGASFTLTLPVRAVHSEPPSVGLLADGAVEEASVERVLSGLRIVIVDDEPDARELLAELLTHEGAEVVVATTADEAFDAIVQHRPDVLVSDVGMPVEDGYALMRRVRGLSIARGGRTPAIALTAYVREEDARRALAAGFQRHVGKPVDPRELVDLVANLGGRVRET